MPFLKVLLWKMSAKSGAMTQRMRNPAGPRGRARATSRSRKFSWGDEDLERGDRARVEDEAGAFLAVCVRSAACSNRCNAEAGALDGLEEAGGDDLAVSTSPRQRRGDRGSLVKASITHTPGSTQMSGHGEAAAMAGETQNGTPTRPGGPSKLRFDVLAQRWPRVSLSGSSQAHGAAGLAPFEPGIEEDAMMPFSSALLLDDAGAGDDEGAHARGHLAGPWRWRRRRACPRSGHWWQTDEDDGPP